MTPAARKGYAPEGRRRSSDVFLAPVSTLRAPALPKFGNWPRLVAMSTMNISLPDELKNFVDEQVKRGYGTSSEYVRELIRKDQDRLRLRELLLAGAASPPTAPADAAYFKRLRSRSRGSRTGGQRR
jgi:antitoxin ParD1/3/4